MTTRFLHHFFAPRSLAVFGATEREGALGGMVLRNIQESGFTGKIRAVNSSGYSSVFDVPCVSQATELDEVPDLAIVCTPIESVPALIETLGDFGVKAAVILSGGATIADLEEGVTPIRQQLLSAARRSGIRLLGPDCMGVIVPGRKLNASYASQPIQAGRVAYLGQSGMLANAMIDWAAGRGVGFSHLITVGDSVDVLLPDLIDYVNQFSPARAILLHLERVYDAQHFMTALRDASRNRLVVAIKSGRTVESDTSGMPPTPGIGNRDQVFDAALARAGVVRVDDSDELIDALETLSRVKPLKGDRLAVVSNGLGPAMLAIDKLISAGGKLASFSVDTHHALNANRVDHSRPGENPVDLGGNATPQDFVEALKIVSRDPNVDTVLVVHAPTRLAPSKQTARTLASNRQHFKRNLLTSWMGLKGALGARDISNQAGIPTYISPEKAVKAFMHMVNYQRVQALLQEIPPSLPFSTNPGIRTRCHELIRAARADQRLTLTHSETAQVLGAYGIPVASSHYVSSPQQAREAAEQMPGAKALKVVHEGNERPFRYRRHPHKLSAGLLQDLDTPEEVASALTRLGDKVQEKFPAYEVHEYCLQSMQRGKHSMQVCAGITRDPVFGPLIVFGIGGYKVNILADRQVALPPLNMTLAADVVGHSHVASLIREHSGHPERDLHRLHRLLVQLSQMASDLPELRGLEINPLLINRDGLLAVDFAMDLGSPARFAIMPYPEELREWVTLKNGWSVEIRPIRAEDAPLITGFHHRLSEESIRFRYFHHKSNLTQRDLSVLSDINYDRQMAFIAEHALETETAADVPTGDTRPDKTQAASQSEQPDRSQTDPAAKREQAREMLGVVRVWNDPDNIRTEFSVIIRDDLQGLGIGSLLMKKMISYCRSVGTLEMVGKVMPENHPMRALMKHLGFTLRYNPEEDVMDAIMRLNDPDSAWQQHRLESRPD